MKFFFATTRVTLGLVCLSVSVILAAQQLGLVPDRRKALIEGRCALCEAIAVHCSALASQGDFARLRAGFEAIVRRNSDIVSAAVRRRDGQILVETGNHTTQPTPDGESSDTAVRVPIMAGNRNWGTLEVQFQPDEKKLGMFSEPILTLVGFVALASFALFTVYLRTILQHLDPSRVIPERVRAALDTLAEGLLVLDRDERIVLANQAFAKKVGRSPQQLQGVKARDLPWSNRDQNEAVEVYPWQQALEHASPQTGFMLGLLARETEHHTFMVNSSPILADDGTCRGVLTSFDDVTQLENKKKELMGMLEMLKQSREEIHLQNERLQILATQDALTGCLNRRSFLEQFESHWSAAHRYGYQLSCIMFDVDHFKSVNDRHGHVVGDQVLQKVATILRACVRDGDLVCRYGGEEFCILLPHLDLKSAKQAAERYRRAIESARFAEVHVTASLGVSTLTLGAKCPRELLDQADKALYAAKRGGRNRVTSWDDVPRDQQVEPAQTSRTGTQPVTPVEAAISFDAVTALISALSFRDSSTAEHCRRVADLCVAAANGLMSIRESYVLEIAALLHDIGKIGVPDHILLKPAPLTEEEWKVMRVHDRIGVEIIRSTFASRDLSDIVFSHHAWYGGNPTNSDLPTSMSIPLGARILAVADAFDAMVSDRVYRKGRAQEEAFAELRRCAGKQFDPTIVERFIEIVQARDQNRSREALQVSKQTALTIGIEIERLAHTLDNQDIPGLATLAGRLRATAHSSGVTPIAEVAGQLEELASRDGDLHSLLQLTNDLLELCRSTQRAYLQDSSLTSPETPRDEADLLALAG